MRKTVIFVITLTLCFSWTALCIAEQIVCPEEIKVAQNAVEIPAGWKATNKPTRYPFTNVSFSEGQPEERIILAPDLEVKYKATWRFDEKSKDGYWISCEYGSTSVVMSKMLPAKIKECTVTYDRAFSQPVVKQVLCK